MWRRAWLSHCTRARLALPSGRPLFVYYQCCAVHRLAQPRERTRHLRAIAGVAIMTQEKIPDQPVCASTELVAQSFGGNVLERAVVSRRDAVRT